VSSSEQGTPEPADLDGGLPEGWSSAAGPRPSTAASAGRPADRDDWTDEDQPAYEGDAVEPDAGQPPSSRRPWARRPADGGGREKSGSFLRELPVLVLIAFVLALLIKALLVQAFWIPSESMERTLLINDRVLVNKVVYHFRSVHRGDIVVFNGDHTGFQSHETVIAPPSNGFSKFVRGVQNLLGLGAPSDKDFIKRVIGVGGDTVACCDPQGRVTVNGKALDEGYVFENDAQPFGPYKVPKGQLWVMGDHRSASSDSRANGTIPTSAVVGRAFVRVWPLSRFGFLTTPGTFHGIPSASGPAPGLGGNPVDQGLGAGTPASVPLVGALALAFGTRGGRGRLLASTSRRRRARSRR
jgi:signal peptidase I